MTNSWSLFFGSPSARPLDNRRHLPHDRLMPFISVTRLRIRSIRFLPFFAIHTLGANAQVKKARGFLGGSLLPDRSWTFWTMTAWDSQDSMRNYMTTGAHRAAMPRLLNWGDEASVVHWDQPMAELPSWEEADRKMRANGRASKLRHPSPEHATLSYRPPRFAAAVPLQRARSAPP